MGGLNGSGVYVSIPEQMAWTPSYAIVSQTTLTSAATSIDVTGLDINTDGTYYFVLEYYNSSAGGGGISLYYNGDTTDANYQRQRLQAVNSTVSCATAANAFVGTCDAGAESIISGTVTLSGNGYAECKACSGGGANDHKPYWRYEIQQGKHSASLANITQLTFTAATANALGIGTRLTIWKSDI